MLKQVARLRDIVQLCTTIFLTGLVTEEEIGPEGYQINGVPVVAKPVRWEVFLGLVVDLLATAE